MAKMTISGLNELSAKLQRLSAGDAGQAITAGVYKGAGEVADALRATVSGLAANDGSWSFYKKTISGLSETQKQGLLDGIGIASIENSNGSTTTKVSFSGYNKHLTEHYPKGQPNALVARSLESGSSIGTKRPFVRPTVAKIRKAVSETMAETVEKEIKKAMK